MRAQGLRHAARMIRRASSGRRSMRAPSMAVRETAAQEIEERQIDWAYSSPVVALDAAWNSAFVLAASAALFLTWSDSLRLPLRVWIAGYALQCLLHVFCVCVEFRRRRRVRNAVEHGRDDYFEESRDDSKNKNDEETEEPSGGIMKECGTECPIERTLNAEDAECCICLSAYEDGIELRELPCGHHFHSSCVEKWLHINSTCPLCKYDISKRYSPDGEV
uniref:RING-type E3 ubiquitin transferase n=1 Tax=Chenopodium quinoa TaxID=63459 RepID=A0A803LQP9_CHEQI